MHAQRQARGFTLIEMLVVIMLAVLLMSMGASAFNRMSSSQRLSIGAGAVIAALQQARAHALKTKQVTTVYFLDAGDYDPSVNTPSDFSSYEDIDKAKLPCELVIWADDEVVNSIKLPESVAWLDRNSLPSDFGTSARPYYHRACSLAINFTPGGSAWAEILASNGGAFQADTAGCRTKAACTNIRVFNVEQLPDAKFDVVNGGGAKALFTSNGGNKNPATIAADSTMRNVTWTTIHLNYLTGIAEMVHGPKETWTTE
ncbi:MAG: prepilin-type N-terminal cleavage/methylation domain-containing protein [Planctomycetes bacterium]|nr:prepilin-type N-terminal cleavage/methylation domain-containing protein [Planctomycetota bacterium]